MMNFCSILNSNSFGYCVLGHSQDIYLEVANWLIGVNGKANFKPN